MTTHQMKLAASSFKKIISGDKIIESRLYDEKRQRIIVGDQIEFICRDEPRKKVLTKVKALYLYRSFKELFFDFPPEYFGGKLRNGLIQEIKKFYSKDEQKKYRVVGIRIELAK